MPLGAMVTNALRIALTRCRQAACFDENERMIFRHPFAEQQSGDNAHLPAA